MINNIKSKFDIKNSMKKENFKIKEEINFSTNKLDTILTELKEIEEKFPSSEFKTVVIDEKFKISDNGLKCTATLKLVKRKR